MKQINLILFFALLCGQGKAQEELPETKAYKKSFGIKAGFNVAHLHGTTPDFRPKGKNGFTVSAFYAPRRGKGLGYRTELVFSRQGFSLDDSSSRVDGIAQDYLYMPHLTTFTIANRVQLQAGAQVGYLLHAKKEEKKESAGEEQKLMDMMKRFDYGAAFGIEIYPFKGLIVGARYNVSFGNLYKRYEEPTAGSNIPLPLPFDPTQMKGRNGVIHFFTGYRF